MRKVAALLLAGVPMALLSADYTYEWKAGEKPASVLDGKVTISYEGDDIKSMRLLPDAGGKIVFTGDKMTFTAERNGAYLTNACTQASAVVFRNPVEFKGHFRPMPNAYGIVSAKYDGKENFLSDQYDTVVLKNARLEDWVPVATKQNNVDSKGNTIGGWGNPANTMYVSALSRSEGKLKFQFQTSAQKVNDSEYVSKCVEVVLFRDGDDIKGRVGSKPYQVWSKAGALIQNGYDVDALVFNSDYSERYNRLNYSLKTQAAPRTTERANGAYGINTISFIRALPPTVFRFENAVTIGYSSFCASAYVKIEIADASKLSPTFGTWPSAYGMVALQGGSVTSTGASYAGGGAGWLVFENTGAVGAESAFTLTKANNLGAGTEVLVSGGDGARTIVKTTDFQAYPTNGTVRIAKGGQLDMGGSFSTAGAGINGGTCYNRAGKPTFMVEKGGVLRQLELYTLGNYEKVILDGGELILGVGRSATDVGTYLEGITMKNGATIKSAVTTQGLRVGNHPEACVFSIAGNSPSTNSITMLLMGQKTSAAKTVFSVRKTGDYEADFVQNADFSCYVDASEPDKSNPIYYTDAQVRKTGDGTMLLNGFYKSGGKLTLEGGVFALAKENAWTGKATLAFNGGELAVMKSQTLPQTAVSAKNGTLRLAGGAKVVFKDCSAVEWSGVLDIEKAGYLTGDVKFLGISPAQRLRVSVNGKPASVLEDGSVSSGSSIGTLLKFY